MLIPCRTNDSHGNLAANVAASESGPASIKVMHAKEEGMVVMKVGGPDEFELVSEESFHESDEEWGKLIPKNAKVIQGCKAKSRACKKQQLKKKRSGRPWYEQDPWRMQPGSD